MRILVDIRHLTHPQLSGVGEYTVNILRALFRLQTPHEYILLSTGKRRPIVDFSSHPHVRHVHVGIPNKLLNLSLLTTQHPHLDRLAGGRYDCLFLPNLNIVRTSPHLPTVLTVHDLSWKYFPEFFSPKMRGWHASVDPKRLIQNARAIITPSHATKNDVLRTFSVTPENVSVIPHGLDPLFTPHADVRDHGVRSRYKLPKRFALFMGTLEPRKNILALIEGVREYRERSGDPLHLVLAGGWGWNTRELKRTLQEPSIRTWVHHLGYVASADRPALYRSAAVFTWPSIYEGFGLPVLEAMACATPIITSHTSSLPELTADAAILIDPYNPRDLCVALEQLFENSTLETHLRTHGSMRAKGFSWQNAAEQTLHVFEKIKNG